MPIQNCPIDIPEGWKFVAFRPPNAGEMFCVGDGKTGIADHNYIASKVIIRRIRPALQVGDWVRLARGGFAFSGRLGRVESIAENGKARVVFDRDSDGLYRLEHLTKQTRTVTPYTLDQCIAAAARIGSRDVLLGGDRSCVTSFDCDRVFIRGWGLFPYAEAATKLTWVGGEAFGIEKWEDAK